jgi:ABC-type multidrug transport system fused ATPase/permease subunit
MDAVEGTPGDKKLPRPVLDGKLILAEEKAQGRMSRQAVQLFVTSLGGVWFWVWPLCKRLPDIKEKASLNCALLGNSDYYPCLSGHRSSSCYLSDVVVRSMVSTVLPSRLEGRLGHVLPFHLLRHRPSRNRCHVCSVSSSLLIFCIYLDRSLIFRSTSLGIYSYTVWQYGAVRSGAAIHKRLLDSVFSSTLRFLDVTPQGRIIQRFTRDTCVIDGQLTQMTTGVRSTFHQIDASVRLLTWVAVLDPSHPPHNLFWALYLLLYNLFFHHVRPPLRSSCLPLVASSFILSHVTLHFRSRTPPTLHI